VRFSLCLLLFGACNPPDPFSVDARNYAMGCTRDSDCVAVIAGDQCQPCACPNAAIAKSDAVLFEADRSSARAQCDPSSQRTGCEPCPNLYPRCDQLTQPTSMTNQFFCRLR
jgi:hypothetical protein